MFFEVEFVALLGPLMSTLGGGLLSGHPLLWFITLSTVVMSCLFISSDTGGYRKFRPDFVIGSASIIRKYWPFDSTPWSRMGFRQRWCHRAGSATQCSISRESNVLPFSNQRSGFLFLISKKYPPLLGFEPTTLVVGTTNWRVSALGHHGRSVLSSLDFQPLVGSQIYSYMR